MSTTDVPEKVGGILQIHPEVAKFHTEHNAAVDDAIAVLQKKDPLSQATYKQFDHYLNADNMLLTEHHVGARRLLSRIIYHSHMLVEAGRSHAELAAILADGIDQVRVGNNRPSRTLQAISDTIDEMIRARDAQ